LIRHCSRLSGADRATAESEELSIIIVSDLGEWNRIIEQHELFVTVRSDEKVETFEEHNK